MASNNFVAAQGRTGRAKNYKSQIIYCSGLNDTYVHIETRLFDVNAVGV